MGKHRQNQIVAPEWIVGPTMQRKQGILWYTIVIVIGAIIFHFAEWITRKNDFADSYSIYFSGVNLYYLWHGLSFVGYAIFMKDLPIITIFGLVPKIEIVRIADFGAKNIIKQFIVGFGLCVAAEVVFGVILRPVLGIVSGVERVFFYVFGGVMEEGLYRFLIQNVIAGLIAFFLRTYGSKQFRKKNGIGEYWLPGIISMLITSFIFMLAHLGVYGATLSSLIGTFGLGVAFGTSYLISNNILIPILLHACVNGFTKAFQVASGMASTIWEFPAIGGEFLVIFVAIMIILIFSLITKAKKSERVDNYQESNENPATRWWIWIIFLIAISLVTIFTIPWWFSIPVSIDLPVFDPVMLILIVFILLFTIIIIIEGTKFYSLYQRKKSSDGAKPRV